MKFTNDARDKFADLVVRRNGMLDQTPECYLRNSRQLPPDTATYYIFARELRLTDIGAVSLRRVDVNDTTAAYFVLYGDEVVEVMTHRAFTRTFRRRYEYNAGAAVDGGRDGERFAAAMKHKRPQRIGGGLMRGPASPRSFKLRIIDTHALRTAKD